MKKYLLLILSILSVSYSYSQSDHRMTDYDRLMAPFYAGSRAGSSPSTASVIPPQSHVRTIGEWEELQGLLVTWVSYTSMIREIIRNARLECTVYVVCTNQQTVINDLLSNNIDTSNVKFLITPFNSVWSRDYGPWNAYTNDVDSLITIDWIYNRPRPSDDNVSIAVANQLGTPLYQTTTSPWDLVHTGGNFMTDGFGTGFSSNLILTDNTTAAGFGVNHTASEIDTIMNHFMGIDRYIRFPTLPYDEIHHIDMHIKLLDEETLLVGEYPQGVADGPQIEANLQYILANYNSVFGTPYKVIRIPMPPDGSAYPNSTGRYFTYTNSSFINKTIIVPIYNIPQDSIALRIYREALPGYKVVGINSVSSISALGALHCITKELATADPLLISHHALANTTDTINSYPVIARIQHRTGIFTATLYYRTDTLQPYQSIAMSILNLQNNLWTADIPTQHTGTKVYYYISGTSVSGKSQTRPMPAPDAFWSFDVTGVTGLENEIANANNLLPVFPNPCKSITCIPVILGQQQHIKAELFDLQGRLIQSIWEGNLSAGEHKLFMDAGKFVSGVYVLKVNLGTELFVQKISVK